jgi:hypothetical protein
MAIDVKKLIAAISPDVYCDDVPGPDGKILRDEVKKIVKMGGYLEAAKKAKLKDSGYLDVAHLGFIKGAFELEGLKKPIEQHSLVYDAFAQNLEPIYFWILDYVNGDKFGSSEKLTDNFVSSAGSGHFAEMQARATRMQEEGMKILVAANNVLRSVLNLVYDLKEWKLKLAPYDLLNSENKNKKSSAILTLKQTWMDVVDIKRQTTSLKGMAQQQDYVTLIDAFMAAESLENVKDLDLNDRVKRILMQRVAEFERWVKESEDQLRKRFEIEKTYLRAQVNSLKLYARWAKPYLKAAKQLEQNLQETSDLVTMFNNAIFELVLLARGKYDPKKDVANGDLPKMYETMKLRQYYPITIIEFRFRTVPDKSQTQQGGYSFRGRAEVKFTSFALNEDELKVLREELTKDDLGDVFDLVEGATEKSLGTVKEDIDEFLEENEKEIKKEEKVNEDLNPFSALASLFRKVEKKGEKKDLSKGILPDTYHEKVIRSQAIMSSRWICRELYDKYKKAHNMPAFPPSVML